MRINKLVNGKFNNNHKIFGLKTNSKKVKNNDVFYAIKGSIFDGNKYIKDAIKNGAKTIITEDVFIDAHNYPTINFVYVDDIRKTLALHAKKFFKNISKQLTLIGITGTN